MGEHSAEDRGVTRSNLVGGNYYFLLYGNMEMTTIKILDTTLRDGEQTPGMSLTSREKLNIAKYLLTEVKVDIIEVASALVSGGEKKTVSEICRWAKSAGMLNKIEILGFVDKNKSVDWLNSSGGKAINLLTKGSLKHLTMQLKKTPEEHIKNIQETVDYAKKQGVRTNVYLEDWSNGMLNSQDYVLKLTSALSEMNIGRIMLPDTLGILSPDRTKNFVEIMTSEFPEVKFDFHAHNDYGLATANTLSAVKAGCKCVHVTVNSLGERAGNAPLDEVAAAIHDHTSFTTGINEKKLFEISELVSLYSGGTISQNKPITGKNVFTQTAGIHADGDKKGSLYMNLLIPQRFGRERGYALGKLSGTASLEHNLERFGILLSAENKKKVLKRIKEMSDKKAVVTSGDLPFIVADVLDEPGERKLKIESCLVASGKGVTPTASVVLEYNGEKFKAGASGDGGYDAFMNALNKIAKKIELKLPRLLDYEVRIPPGGETDAIVETVIVWQQDEKKFKTIGVHTDQVMAAVRATEKMLNIVARVN